MAKLYGSRNPSESVFLLSEEVTTEYEKAVEAYNSTGRIVLDWQKDVLSHIMAKNEDGLWVYTKFGYSVPRRNGKSEILGVREFGGLLDGEKMLHTAHRTTTSHNAWKNLCRMLNDAGYVDKAEVPKADIDEGKIPTDMLYKAHKANGLESVELLSTGGVIHFRTRSAKGGLGEGFDLLVIDEAQEYQDDQESSLKYTVSSSANGQTIMCGTPPTPVSSGTVFAKFRENVLAGNVKNAGWCAWAVDEMTDPHNKDAWFRCNPSLGYILTERAVEDEIGSDEVDFNIQRLGLWLKHNLKSAITLPMWDGLKVDEKPELQGKLHIGVKFGKDGKNISMGLAVRTADGRAYVESLFCRPVSMGVDWICSFLKRVDYAACWCDGKSGEQLLLDSAKDFGIKNIKFLSVADAIAANALFEQNIYSGSLCHSDQEVLRNVATNTKKRPIGSAGGFGYESIFDDMDISVLDSVIFALWSLQTKKDKKPQKIIY